MKVLLAPLFQVLSLIIISGCVVAQRAPVVLATVGPSHRLPESHVNEGTLIVYSDFSTNPNDPDHPPHGAYRIYSADGSLFRTVNNRTGSFDQDPIAVNLPAGRYNVRAWAVNCGAVSVPVLIVAGQRTTVDLNQEIFVAIPPSDDSWVRLPNSHVVGKKPAP